MADLNIPYNNGNIESIYQQDKMGNNPSNPDSVPSANYLPISNNNSGKNGLTYGIVPMYADKLAEDGELPSLSMDDNGVSANIINKPFNTTNIFEMDYFKGLKHSRNLFNLDEIDLHNKTYRFGILNPNMALSGVREVLFFTKPDLSILKRNDITGKVYDTLNGGLAGRTFWEEMLTKRRTTINSLQGSVDGWTDPFNHLLQNTVSSNLEIPGLSSEGIETTKNAYGVNITYRGSSEASNDSFDFSLEFKDTKWLDVYYYFKMYEEYETLKHHGAVAPWKPYISSKILHDQFAIYKFLLDDDNETILYYAKFWGVYPKSLPRDTFSNTSFDTGITYSIEFKGQFFDDSDPIILREFNDLAAPLYNDGKVCKYRIDVYNDLVGRIDGRAAKCAYVVQEPAKRSPTGFVYKLKWKGSDAE
jgi:hypothetical protein